MRTALVSFSTMVLGCWSSPAPEVLHNTAIEPVREPASATHHSLWRGVYGCAQGVTALQLTIDVGPGGEASAIFDFAAHPSNPGVPSGSFRLRGTVHESGPILEVRLDPDRWINQPDNYVMVGLTASSDREQRRLAGSINDKSCTGVQLRRID